LPKKSRKNSDPNIGYLLYIYDAFFHILSLTPYSLALFIFFVQKQENRQNNQQDDQDRGEKFVEFDGLQNFHRLIPPGGLPGPRKSKAWGDQGLTLKRNPPKIKAKPL
jgi:hypothetical protein